MTTKIVWLNLALLFFAGVVDAEDFFLTIPRDGKAAIPLFNEFNNPGTISLNNFKCNASHSTDTMFFEFTIPVSEHHNDLKPASRDAKRIWDSDHVEIFLKHRGDIFHYGIDYSGSISDEKNRNKDWISKVKVSRKQSDNVIHLQVAVPYEDIQLEEAELPCAVKGNIAICNDGKIYTWTTSQESLHNENYFGTLQLSNNDCYLESIEYLPVHKYSQNNICSTFRCTITNPTPKDVIFTKEQYHIPAKESNVINIDFQSDFNKKTFEIKLNIGNIFSLCQMTKNVMCPQIDLVYFPENKFIIDIVNAQIIKTYASQIKAYLDGNQVTECLPLPELNTHKIDISRYGVGYHKLELYFFDQNAKFLFKEEQMFYVLQPPHLEYDLAKMDFEPYYPEVRYDNGEITAARSRFSVPKSVFPEHISVTGIPILSAPVTLVYNGREITFDNFTILKINRNQIIAKTEKEIGNRRITVYADFQYDGLTWYDIEIKGETDFKYDSLKVLIPLKLSQNVAIAQGQKIYNDDISENMPRPIPYTDKYIDRSYVLQEGVSNWPLSAFLSLSTFDKGLCRGLCLATEGPIGWNLKNYDSTYTIEKKGNSVVCAMNVSDGKKPIRLDTIHFSFGIQPFPMRNYPDNFHQDYRIDSTFMPQDYKSKYDKLKREKIDDAQVSFFQTLKNFGATTELAFENWSEYAHYWKSFERNEDMMYYVKHAHENNLKVIFYFGFFLSDKIPEYELYHHYIMLKPSTSIKTPELYYKRHWKIGPDNQRVYLWCKHTFWSDCILHGIDKAADRYDFDGVFIDGITSPLPCASQLHGCGTIDPYGRLVYTFPIKAARRNSALLFNIGKKHKKNFIIDIHTNFPFPSDISLASCYWTGESAHTLGYNKSVIPPELLPGWMDGTMYGVPCDMLMRPPYQQDAAWGQALLVDTYVRLAYGGGPAWHKATSKVWGAFEKNSLTHDTFVSFFDERNKVKIDNKKILVSYYDAEKALVLVVSNYFNKNVEAANLNLKAFEGINTDGEDIWLNERYKIHAGIVNVSVPPNSFRMIIIKKI